MNPSTMTGTDWEADGEVWVPVSDEELTELALAANADAPLDADAVPLSLYPEQSPHSLPVCYLPPVMARATRGWRTPVVLMIIAAFLLIDLLGLCITWGQLVAA